MSSNQATPTKLRWLWKNIEGIALIFIAIFIAGFLLFSSGLLVLSFIVSTPHEKGMSIASLLGLLVLCVLCFAGGLRLIKNNAASKKI